MWPQERKSVHKLLSCLKPILIRKLSVIKWSLESCVFIICLYKKYELQKEMVTIQSIDQLFILSNETKTKQHLDNRQILSSIGEENWFFLLLEIS